jgi:hypothetical protein
MVAVLVLGSVVASQKLRAKGTDMAMAQNVSIPELTEAISVRLVAQWEAWKNQDAALVTYFADVKTPGDNVEHQMAVGEVWVKRNGRGQSAVTRAR